MYYHEDWLIRQIQLLIQSIAAAFFNKKIPKYEYFSELRNTDTDILYVKILDLLADNNINEAENLLFEKLNPNNRSYLLIALDFYSMLNSKSDEQLEKADFSREEIESGLHEVLNIFRVNLV